MGLEYDIKQPNVDSSSDNGNVEAGDVKLYPKNGDVALDFLARGINAEETAPLSERESKALLRKIDIMVVPIMALVYGLQYLDKILINFAAVMVRPVHPMDEFLASTSIAALLNQLSSPIHLISC